MNRFYLSVLLGTAVGDSLGLPAENLPPWKIRKRWPGAWTQRFVFGRGMVSDDTEHTIFVAQCLARGTVDAASFQRMLAWKLRCWLLCIPVGIGFATLRAILKLWMGFHSSRSGVFSAGNGPAMRSALIGAYLAGDLARLRQYVKASTCLTHTDPKAETAALAVALTAAWTLGGLQPQGEHFDEIQKQWISAGADDADWLKLIEKIEGAKDRQLTVSDFALELGLQKGVTGYAYHTVPVALYAWLSNYGNYRAGVEAVLNCGGDTDTVGAITGALLAINGEIPEEWISGLSDYPISRTYMQELAVALEFGPGEVGQQIPSFAWIALPFRNLVFLSIVIAHVCRRLIS